MLGESDGMIRHLALFLLAASTPLNAAGLPRGFTVTSFDRIRIEAPYAVTLATGRAPSARAEGSPAALDAIDLRVEGTTLILRQRSGYGSLSIDKMTGLSVDLAVQGPGTMSVGALNADRINGSAQGSGRLVLAGRTKAGHYVNRGTASLSAEGLAADERRRGRNCAQPCDDQRGRHCAGAGVGQSRLHAQGQRGRIGDRLPELPLKQGQRRQLPVEGGRQQA
jgi:hypothetical protein